MLVLTDLPLEVVAEILKNLDTLESLSQAVLTCRHIYSAVKEIPSVAAAIIRNKIPDALLPYAVAVQEAQGQAIPRNDLLYDLFEQPALLAARLTRMHMSKAWTLWQMYSIIQKRATEFATTAWTRLSEYLPPGTHALDLDLSPTENVRFCRAIYRVELCYALFGYGPQAMTYRTSRVEDTDLYLSGLAPWDLEQISCIYRYLDRRLAEGLNTCNT